MNKTNDDDDDESGCMFEEIFGFLISRLFWLMVFIVGLVVWFKVFYPIDRGG